MGYTELNSYERTVTSGWRLWLHSKETESVAGKLRIGRVPRLAPGSHRYQQLAHPVGELITRERFCQ
jgi:hypothetical protein